MGERALPTVQVLSEVRRHKRRAVEVGRETPRNKNTGVQDHQKGIRGEEWRVQLTESAKGHISKKNQFTSCASYASEVIWRLK